MQRCRKNNIVAIVFQDHSRGVESLEFVLFGRVVKQSKAEIVVSCWAYTDHKYKPADDDSNVICFTIVKSAIKRVKVLHAN